jgi:hypothetical protein
MENNHTQAKCKGSLTIPYNQYQDSLPITNNLLLPFIPPPPKQPPSNHEKTQDLEANNRKRIAETQGSINENTKTNNQNTEISFDNPESGMYVSQGIETAAALVYNVSSWYSSFLVFGCVFLISGSLLFIIAFYNIHRSSKTPVFGPLLLGTGLLSCIIGTLLGIINKKRRNEVKQRRNIYENFSSQPIQVREEPRKHCYTISKKFPQISETNPSATGWEKSDTSTNWLTVPGLMVTVTSPSQMKTWKEKRDSYRLRENTLDVSNDNIVIEIPSSRRASFHGHSLDLPEPTSRPVSPCLRHNSVDQQDDGSRQGSIEMKECGAHLGGPVVDTQ